MNLNGPFNNKKSSVNYLLKGGSIIDPDKKNTKERRPY